MENQISSLKKGDTVWALRTDPYGYYKEGKPYLFIDRVSEDENSENDKIYIESELFPMKDYWIRVYAFNEHFSTSPPNKGEETAGDVNFHEYVSKFIEKFGRDAVDKIIEEVEKKNFPGEPFIVPVLSPEKTLEEINEPLSEIEIKNAQIYLASYGVVKDSLNANTVDAYSKFIAAYARPYISGLTSANAEIERLKAFEAKWKALDEKVGKVYETNEGDLCTIGEICASEMGYMF